MGCPECGDDTIVVVHVEYECKNKHRYAEAVELPKPEVPRLTLKRPSWHGDHADTGDYNERMKMPFGKHKGTYIEDLDTDYIQWCLTNLERLDERLKTEMENQLTLRGGRGVKR